jgi:hypothetical protein
MKTLIMISSLLLLVSCHSLDDNATTLLNTPVGEVKLTVSGETFTINFGYDDYIKEHIEYADAHLETFTQLKTRDDLINLYKNTPCSFYPGYSSMFDTRESFFCKNRIYAGSGMFQRTLRFSNEERGVATGS